MANQVAMQRAFDVCFIFRSVDDLYNYHESPNNSFERKAID